MMYVMQLFFAVLTSAAPFYEVPVPSELRDFANYPMDYIEIRQTEKEVRVRYALPKTLVGVESDFDFRGVPGKELSELTDKNGKMTCILSAAICRVKYTYLGVDAAEAAQELRKIGASEAEIESRLKVTARFGGDLEGIIHFDRDDTVFSSYFRP